MGRIKKIKESTMLDSGGKEQNKFMRGYSLNIQLILLHTCKKKVCMLWAKMSMISIRSQFSGYTPIGLLH